MPTPTLADRAEDYCYLSTIGRVSGKPHTVEIWFAIDGPALYILAGGRERADFVRNAMRNSVVFVRIAQTEFGGQARIVPPGPEDERARNLLLEKYTPRSDSALEEWGREALVFAVDLVTS